MISIFFLFPGYRNLVLYLGNISSSLINVIAIP